jgi:hypothetical protein
VCIVTAFLTAFLVSFPGIQDYGCFGVYVANYISVVAVVVLDVTIIEIFCIFFAEIC